MDIFQGIHALDLPQDSYVVIGGSVLVAIGLLDHTEDIDLCVSPAVFEQFLQAGWRQEPGIGKTLLRHDIYDIGVGFGQWSLEELLADALHIKGLPFINPAKLLEWQHRVNRPKDRHTTALLEKYLQAGHDATKQP